VAQAAVEQRMDKHDDDDLDDLDDDEPKEAGSFAGKMIGDLARRALMTGIGAVFMSEDALRGTLNDLKLPKEAMHYVVGQADKTKRELVTTIARETRAFLGTIEIDKMIARALAGTTLEVSARIRVVPKPDGGLGFKVEGKETRLTRESDPPAEPTTAKTKAKAKAHAKAAPKKRSKDPT
jgi:hypothetical protein